MLVSGKLLGYWKSGMGWLLTPVFLVPVGWVFQFQGRTLEAANDPQARV